MIRLISHSMDRFTYSARDVEYPEHMQQVVGQGTLAGQTEQDGANHEHAWPNIGLKDMSRQ